MNFYNENDPKAAAWLRELIRQGLIPAGEVDERSITEIKPDELTAFTQCHFFAGIGGWSFALQLAGWPADRPVWTGSCPCQPFSAAGKGRGVADERHLWPVFRDLIRARQPSITFGEQVASKLGREWLAGVFADMEGMGYQRAGADLCAAGVGAPHIRQRLYWMAYAENSDGRSELPTGGARSGRGGFAGGGEVGRMGHSNGAGSQPRGQAAASNGHGRAALADGSIVGMAVADGRDACAEGLQRGGEHGQQPEDRGLGGLGDADHAGPQGLGERGNGTDERIAGPAILVGGMEHANSGGCWEERERGGLAQIRGERTNEREPIAQSGSHGFWSAFDLLPCLDGKARRIEPGTFPLAHGISGRVGLLRGYGNAIVPQVAAEFVRAAMEAIADL